MAGYPFMPEPILYMSRQSQAWFFNNMADGTNPYSGGAQGWAPDGCMCDNAEPAGCNYKQGDGNVPIQYAALPLVALQATIAPRPSKSLHHAADLQRARHRDIRSDWTVEETLSALVMQSEMLLMTRNLSDMAAFSARFLRTSNFLETRRDPATGMTLFLTGPSSNLLAPSFGGWPLGNGRHAWSYLTGVSVTYTAALNRLIECEKLLGNTQLVSLYTSRRDKNLQGLTQLFDPSGSYLIRSLDPNGTMHGVVGQDRHGYFEASPNHDAVAFRVVDDAKAESIFATIDKLGPQLRPNVFMLPNTDTKGRLPGDPAAVGYDDMACGDGKTCGGIFEWGTWVNGGVWTTTEARAVLAYLRLNRTADALASVQQMISKFATVWRMDNPLVNFGLSPYQPSELTNQVIDNYGNLAAMIRGQFEYLYTADTLTLIPHIPDNVTTLKQNFGIRWGAYMLFINTTGVRSSGIASVTIPGAKADFNSTTVTLTYATLPTATDLSIQAINSTFLTASTPVFVSIAFRDAGKRSSASLQDRDTRHKTNLPSASTFPVPALWLAADTLKFRNGSAVTVWPSSGTAKGNATVFLPDSTWSSPSFIVDAFGTGRPAVRFSGNRSSLTGEVPLGSKKTIMGVIRDLGSLGTCCNDVFASWVGNVESGVNGLGTKEIDAGTVLEIDFVNSADDGSTNVAGKAILATLVFDSDGTALLSGNALCSESVIGPQGVPGFQFSVGSRNNGDLPYDRFFKGDIAELMVFNTTLNSTELAAAASHLTQKWGLPVTSSCSAVPNCTAKWDSAVPPTAVANMTRFSSSLQGDPELRQTLVADWAGLMIGYAHAYTERCSALNNGTYVWPATRPAGSVEATLAAYINTWTQLSQGLAKQIEKCHNSTNPIAKRLYAAWVAI